jgi:hypothetical protein
MKLCLKREVRQRDTLYSSSVHFNSEKSDSTLAVPGCLTWKDCCKASKEVIEERNSSCQLTHSQHFSSTRMSSIIFSVAVLMGPVNSPSQIVHETKDFRSSRMALVTSNSYEIAARNVLNPGTEVNQSSLILASPSELIDIIFSQYS